MRRFGVFFLLAGLAVSAYAEDGWARYRVFVRDANEARRLGDSSLGLFSDDVTLGATDIIVGPNDGPELLSLNIPFTFVSVLPNPEGWDQGAPEAIDYRNQYFRYNTILAQYEEWRAAYPAMISRTQFATSWNNRPLYAYRIAPIERDPPLRSVVIICGIHAREWISPAVGMHVFERLIDQFDRPISGGPIQGGGLRFPKRTAYYVVPVINPDGYEHTWTNNRYWRKNRRNNGNGTYGVDLNRNFSKGWGGEGSSGNTNSDTYRGPSAFSEPESNGFRQWLDTIPPVAGFIDFHSYGEYILWAWGYTSSFAPGDAWLRATGLAMRDGIQALYGHAYTSGTTGTTLYIASGVSPDYVYDRYNAAAYTIELRDTGQFGFVLPESQISATQDEGWAGFVKLVQRVLNR